MKIRIHDLDADTTRIVTHIDQCHGDLERSGVRTAESVLDTITIGHTIFEPIFRMISR